jgi:hypothetical protein
MGLRFVALSVMREGLLVGESPVRCELLNGR